MNTVTPVRILLVEDSPDDVLLTSKALGRARVANHLTVASTGEQALRVLRDGARNGDPATDLVLLDLNLPGMSGSEVLQEIKSDRSLRHLPVIALTTSADERDIARAYDSYVNAYVTKPVGFRDFAESIRSIEDFWFTVVHLPSR